MSGRHLASVLGAAVLFATAGASSANADVFDPNSSGSLQAPSDDGTNGAFDGSAQEALPDDNSEAPNYSGTQCEPNTTWLSSSSLVKSGKVTNWSKHIKNDTTTEKFTFTTSNTFSVGASGSTTGSLTASAAIKKVAEGALNITSNFGLNGTYASTTSVSREVNFNKRGAWVIWAGNYAGSGKVVQRRCASNGASYSTIGSGSAKTFDKARVTGLTNCANSVSDKVEVAAKALC